MKKINNEGFAISGVIYSLLLLFVMLLSAILLMLVNRKFILDSSNKDIMKKIENIEEKLTENYIKDKQLLYIDYDFRFSQREFIDLSGNGTSVTLNDFVSGDFHNDGLYFNGDSAFINTGIKNYNNSNYSFVARFKMHKFADTSQKIIGDWEVAGGGLQTRSNFKKIGFSMYSQGDNGYKNLYSNMDLELDLYYTVAGVYDGTNMKLYINGNLEAIMHVPGNVKTSPVPIYIGANPQPSGNAVDLTNMTLKYAMIYNKALTDKEVLDMYGVDIKRYKLSES